MLKGSGGLTMYVEEGQRERMGSERRFCARGVGLHCLFVTREDVCEDFRRAVSQWRVVFMMTSKEAEAVRSTGRAVPKPLGRVTAANQVESSRVRLEDESIFR